MYMTVRDIPMF